MSAGTPRLMVTTHTLSGFVHITTETLILVRLIPMVTLMASEHPHILGGVLAVSAVG